jgi:hypothetical protein
MRRIAFGVGGVGIARGVLSWLASLGAALASLGAAVALLIASSAFGAGPQPTTSSASSAPSTASAHATSATADRPGSSPDADAAHGNAALAGQMEDIKHNLVELKRDLSVLEEDLLYPASTQVAVYLSMDVGAFFALDSVTLKLNGKDVTHYLYTDKQADALFRGGVQRLFVGNVKQGNNRLTAFFTGRGPEGRDYKRAATVEFDKTFEPTTIELKISDSEAKYQPEFVATVSP